MVRYVIFSFVVLVVFMTAVVFASINTDVIILNLAFTSIEIKQSLAMMAFLSVGWLFGVFCAAVFCYLACPLGFIVALFVEANGKCSNCLIMVFCQ